MILFLLAFDVLPCYISLQGYSLRTVKKGAHLPRFGGVGKTLFKTTVGRRELLTSPLAHICYLLALSVLKFFVLAYSV